MTQLNYFKDLFESKFTSYKQKNYDNDDDDDDDYGSELDMSQNYFGIGLFKRVGKNKKPLIIQYQ